jgi:A/G-specific adenine glycosylase
MEINILIEKWYAKHGRELPWRKSHKPYYIWLSEIILQQTRVEQGSSYYLNFIKIFPEINFLAEAEIDEVLNAWQGLGYYSRARNLHATAKEVVEKYHGHFPENYNDLIKLKGIGPYTAGAILSMAYDQKVPAIDGNVKRIISRLFLITEDINSTASTKKIKEIVELLLKTAKPSVFNQAMMDLGSMICKPRHPDCDNCPLKWKCEARKEGKQNELPVIIKNKKIRNRFFYFIVIDDGSNTYISKRIGNDIWKLLYQFPLIESDKALSENIIKEKVKGELGTNKFDILHTTGNIRHILSHQVITASFIHIKPESPNIKNESYIKIEKQNIGKYPVPRLIENYLEETFSKY